MDIKTPKTGRRAASEPIVPEPGADGQFPAVRLRRNRRTDWARRLVRENTLTTGDLIWPLFLIDGKKTRVPVASMLPP